MATRETFLECAAPLIIRKGLRGSGLNEIIGATGLTKGAFYYYFKDKNDFCINYIQYIGRIMLELIEYQLAKTDVSPSRSLLGFFEARALEFKKNGFVGGCPLGNMSQELPDSQPQLRCELEKAFSAVNEAVVSNLEICQGEGLLRLEDDVGALSVGLLSAWQGALMHAKLYKRIDALDTFLNLHFGPFGWFEDQPYDRMSLKP